MAGRGQDISEDIEEAVGKWLNRKFLLEWGEEGASELNDLADSLLSDIEALTVLVKRYKVPLGPLLERLRGYRLDWRFANPSRVFAEREPAEVRRMPLVLEAAAKFLEDGGALLAAQATRWRTERTDLADHAWRVVKVTSDGWQVLDNAPVRFRRPNGMLALPLPERDGTLDALRQLINVDDDTWTLIVAWLIGTLRPDRPFPVLAVAGEHGTAKTTMLKMLRRLVDPNVADLRAFPKQEDDLVIAAVNGWIIGLDNVSALPDWLSDALCRLSTGAGFGKRMLYADADEVLFQAKRPIMLNGIPEVATRGDLADRALGVVLATIAAYREEDDLWAAYAAAQPRLVGALLDVVVGALGAFPTVQLERLPRMADFARWATAAEGALSWPRGRFMKAYIENRAAASEQTLEASTVATALRALVATLPRDPREGLPRSNGDGGARQVGRVRHRAGQQDERVAEERPSALSEAAPARPKPADGGDRFGIQQERRPPHPHPARCAKARTAAGRAGCSAGRKPPGRTQGGRNRREEKRQRIHTIGRKRRKGRKFPPTHGGRPLRPLWRPRYRLRLDRWAAGLHHVPRGRPRRMSVQSPKDAGEEGGA
jgi:hypothetical protein